MTPITHPGQGGAGGGASRIVVAGAGFAARLRDRTDTQAPPPVRPGQRPPADPGMIPLTVPEIARLLTPPAPPGHAEHWPNSRRRHQPRARWYHQRTRLARDTTPALGAVLRGDGRSC